MSIHILQYIAILQENDRTPVRRCRLGAVVLRLLVLTILISIAAGGVPAHAKVVVVVADYLSLTDLTESPSHGIARMVAQGGIGLLTPIPGISRSIEAAYVTASAGAYCWGDGAVDEAYSLTEKVEDDEYGVAGEVFARRTGSGGSGTVGHLGIPSLVEELAKRRVISPPGELGDILLKAGKKTAVFGNSDVMNSRRRRAAIIAAANDGSISLGDVSSRMLRVEPFSPTGVVTNWRLVAEEVEDALKAADLVVVDFGDTTRIELTREKLSARAYTAHRGRAIANLSSLLDRIIDSSDEDTTVILASMIAPLNESGVRDRLGPIVVYRAGEPSGALISATTRTAGLVSPVDIAPTVLRALGISVPESMIGAPISIKAGARAKVARLDNVVALDRTLLVPVLAVLGGLGIAAVTAASVAIALGRANVGRNGQLLRGALVFITSIPLAVLLASTGKAEVLPFIVGLAVWMVVLTAGAYLVSSVVRRLFAERVRLMPGGLPIVVLMAATSIVLLADAFTGGQTSRFTLLSAGRFDGYRFYGIGNEYMGAWLGMAFVSIIWIRESWPGWETRFLGRFALILISVALVAALGFAKFGANAGGAISAVVGLGLVYVSGVKKRFGWGDVTALVVGAFVLLALIGAADALISKGPPSHIGRAAHTGGSGWYIYLITMAVRKMTMNLSLIGTTQAQIAIVCSIPFFILWFRTLGPKMAELNEARPALRWGLAGVVVASIAAFLFNDSGVVAWGLMIGYTVAAVLYSMIDSERCVSHE